MKYLPLIWAGLWRKPLRTSLTTLALLVAFVLFGLLQGINAGFDHLVATSRMDRLYVNSRFNLPMPYAYKQEIAQMPGVKSVTIETFLNGAIGGDPKRPMYVGFDDDGFFDFIPEFDVPAAKIAELRGNRSALMLSKQNADRWNLKVGDHVVMKSQVTKKDGSHDWDFDVIGIIDRKDLPGLYSISLSNFEYANDERATGQDQINSALIVLNDPSIAVATAKAIDDRYLNSAAPTRTIVEKLAREDGQKDDNVPTMVNAIVLSTLFALLLMTSNSLMQSFRERIPELGTLKALGFKDAQVLVLVVAEAVVQCLVGAAIGLFIARVATPYIKPLLTGPSAFMTVSWSLIGLGLGVAVAVACISAAVPAWRASRMQIVSALAAR